MINILKNTRKMKLLANTMGMIPRKVVHAPRSTDGPISPSALAILVSFVNPESCRGEVVNHELDYFLVRLDVNSRHLT